jgi:hypothetical protein
MPSNCWRAGREARRQGRPDRPARTAAPRCAPAHRRSNPPFCPSLPFRPPFRAGQVWKRFCGCG